MTRFTSALKSYRWWDYKPPIMLAVAYFQLASAAHPRPLGPTLGALGLFLLSTAGIAGFGHFVNDLFDRDQDREVNAPNVAATRTIGEVVSLVFMLLVLAWVPWIWLPSTAAVLALVGAELLLFILYSAPPVRLKSKGILGALADASYGYTIPVVVSLLVFGQFAHLKPSVLLLVALSAWSFALGLRWVLIHQLNELGRDERSGVRTFAVRVGWRSTFSLLSLVILPAEAGLFLAVLIALGLDAVLVPVGFVGYLVARMVTRYRHRARLPGTGESRRINTMVELNVNLMSNFHTRWLPVLTAATLAIRDPAFLVLLALHLLFFENGPIRLVTDQVQGFRWRFRPTRGVAT